MLRKIGLSHYCRVACFLILSSLCAVSGTPAQSTSATLSGTVEDAQGALVPGVTVAILNLDTSLQRQTVTNESGFYSFVLLPPGRYTLTAEGKGFAKLQVTDLVLNVGDQKALHIQLKAGDVSATVQVNADAPLINESPAVGTVVDRQFVANIPLNGRSFQSLIELTPGVVPAVTTGNNQGQFSVNGQRSNANYFTVDGVSANVQASVGGGINQAGNGSLPALTSFGSTNNLVSLDALQEFKVLTSSFAPEFGRAPGAQILISTRSGTNAFHGTAFNYLRNDVLDANNWFTNANRLRKTALRQNDFGGVFGGPVLLPRFGEGGHQPWYNGRNLTFFFFSYEGLRLVQPKVALTDVPSLTTRQNAPAGMRPYLNAFPLPNGPENPTTGMAPFNGGYSDPSNLNAVSIRIDQKITNKGVLFGRYNHAPSDTIQRNPGGVYSVNTLNKLSSKTQTLTLGHTHAFTSDVNNEFRFNYSRVSGGSSLAIDDFGGASVPPESVLFPAFVSRPNARIDFFILGAASSAFAVGPNADNLQRQINVVDNFSLIENSHSLKFGVDWRRLTPKIGQFEYQQTAFFLGASAIQTGEVSFGSIVAGSVPREPVFTNLSLYAQDSWRVSSRLTLTYGLRWDYNPPPHEANGNEALTVIGLDNPATMSLAPRGTPLYRATRDNFGPRAGVSYLLSKRQGRELVLRGGFGVFYDLGNGQMADAYRGGTFPFASTKLLFGVPFPLSASDATPLPINSSPPVNSTMVVADAHLKLPYTLQWNFAVEQSVGSDNSMSATYVGASGRRLLRGEVLNAPNPTFTDLLSVFRNSATSDYHALQLQYRRRLSRGLQALASYTWSHSIDDISVDNNNFATVSSLTPKGRDRGSSDFDIRHNFSAAITYDLPAPKSHKVANVILSGWSLDNIVRARSATPVDLIGKFVFEGALFFRVRPDVTPGIPLYIDDPSAPGGRLLNNTVDPNRPGCKGPFCPPVGSTQGSLGRNVLRGFPFFQLDTTVRRRFNLTERISVQFRADFFNILNHPNFGNPNFTLTNSTFGRSTAMFAESLGGGGINGGFNPLYQSGGPRSIQFSLKLEF